MLNPNFSISIFNTYHYLIIRNFQIFAPVSFAIKIYQSENILFQNGTLNSSSGTLGNNYGINIWSSSIQFDDMQINHAFKFFLNDVTDSVFNNIIFKSSYRWFDIFEVYYSQNLVISNNILSPQVESDYYWAGIDISNCDNVEIMNNYCANNGLEFEESSNVDFRNNTFSDGDYFTIDRCSVVELYNNTLSLKKSIGIVDSYIISMISNIIKLDGRYIYCKDIQGSLDTQ